MLEPLLRILINSYCALIGLVLNSGNMTEDCFSMALIFPGELSVGRGMQWMSGSNRAVLMHLLCIRIPAM